MRSKSNAIIFLPRGATFVAATYQGKVEACKYLSTANRIVYSVLDGTDFDAAIDGIPR
jgi:hypothetical protein